MVENGVGGKRRLILRRRRTNLYRNAREGDQVVSFGREGWMVYLVVVLANLTRREQAEL